ncbi:hypothetical protein Ddye_008207 [Dipteronia dyeriana]|uniref:BACK domain-containing protein n=1 Tax=Dipteronia dyeriana TaxID=168575 RepID=A0AAD9X926_9ROSI|nr:hypothetical protein Ddye_008207 [Dipteronia dyeriana]
MNSLFSYAQTKIQTKLILQETEKFTFQQRISNAGIWIQFFVTKQSDFKLIVSGSLNILCIFEDFSVEALVTHSREKKMHNGVLNLTKMWAMSTNFFGAVPYNLLLDCVKHPCLTVDSELHLSDALLIWLDANTEHLDCSSRDEDDLTEILKEIRISILPLWFAAGKRRSCYFSKLADESIDSILRLVKTPSTGSINVLGDFDLKHFRIRLTEYSERVNLSGCPQITSAILLLSLLHPSHSMDPASRKVIKQSLINLEHLDEGRISLSLLPTLSFEAVQEVNISKCPRIHLKAAIECFSKLFPSLRTIKAAYLLNFKTITFCKLVQKCPLVCEVDLTVDPSPVILTQISVVSSSPSQVPPVPNKSFIVGDNSLDVTSVYYLRPSLSNIAKLTLEAEVTYAIQIWSSYQNTVFL